MTMLWTGVIALLLIFVTDCSGLSCYKCIYKITVGLSGPPTVVGDKSCGGDDTSKYQTQDCPANQTVCVIQHQTLETYGALPLDSDELYGLKTNSTGVKRGCSVDQGEECVTRPFTVPGDVRRLTSCQCTFGKCNIGNGNNGNNGQTKIVPAILTYTIAIGFLLF